MYCAVHTGSYIVAVGKKNQQSIILHTVFTSYYKQIYLTRLHIPVHSMAIYLLVVQEIVFNNIHSTGTLHTPHSTPVHLLACLSCFTMLSRIAAPIIRRSVARFMSTEAVAANKMTLSFALPHDTIYKSAEVESVILPGTEGEYGVTADHVPTVSELAPGVVQIDHGDGETEKYFIAGGFAFTHPDSHTVSPGIH